MSRTAWFVLLALLPALTPAADDGRVSFLEQEVRDLRREVLGLNRRLDALEGRATRREAPTLPPATSASPAPGTDWLDANKWRRLRTGMTELEAIALLGPPTSMREVDGARVLFYALEIGASGFLGGTVRIRDRQVSEIQVPILQ